MTAKDGGVWAGFGQENFGGCQLGDARLTRRAVNTGELMLRHPGGTPPDKLNCPADLVGFYRLANNAKVTQAKLLECHVERTRAKMHDWARRLTTLGHQTVSVGQNNGQPAREALVRVASGAVGILPPHAHRGEHGVAPLSVWVVHVRELAPPAGATALEWFLLTNVPTEGLQQAVERLDWYRCRGVIEEYHKSQKTGCGIEQMQFTTRRALSAGIAMISVVATQLLRLRDLSRRPDGQDRPATEVVSSDYVEVLSAWRWKSRRTDLSVREFFYALARMGGHQNRAGDRDPGWLVLWRGWTKLQLMVDGARAVRLQRCV